MEARHLGQVYRRRWTIEACFQSFKSRGFDLESTHLKHLAKLKKLVALVSIAFAMCVSLLIYTSDAGIGVRLIAVGGRWKRVFRVLRAGALT